MTEPDSLILGEFHRTLDERHRLSLPAELVGQLLPDGSTDCILAKERPGSLSLWNRDRWQGKIQAGVALVQSKMQAGRLEGRVEDVQRLGRLLSTRHRDIQISGRSRLLIPEGFREFLGVEPGGELLVVGAGVCLELWRPVAWHQYLEDQIPSFRELFDNLSG